MKRLKCNERQNWEAINTSLGMEYSFPEGKQYWNEGWYYLFSANEISEIEKATNELYSMCLESVEYVVKHDLFQDIGILNPLQKELAKESWNRKDFTIYGRFDLMYDGVNPPKFLEYNSQTPTGLLESAIIAGSWKEGVFPNAKQFQNIEDTLIQEWKRYPNDKIYFTSSAFDWGLGILIEELSNVSYLSYTAKLAGKDVGFVPNEDLNIDYTKNILVNKRNGEVISDVFLHIPTEYYSSKELEFFKSSDIRILEPFWKIILHSKAIAKILWKLFPNNKYLLPTYDSPGDMSNYVKKPIISQGGENVEIFLDKKSVDFNNGTYSNYGYIYQEFAEPPNFDGWRPNIGSWLIGDKAAGIMVREERGLIIKNWSRNTPHIIL